MSALTEPARTANNRERLNAKGPVSGQELFSCPESRKRARIRRSAPCFQFRLAGRSFPPGISQDFFILFVRAWC
ncbi:MAG: hypothetical protein LBJ64_09255 [Deltaproteobacteria bacterium]|nr:hypothetical protein [Deltaproteobacteria bacterium]